MLANYFEIWMLIVTLLSAVGFLQAFLSDTILASAQFSLRKDQVTPLTRRLFGAWTLVAAAVRAQCALDCTNKAIFQLTLFTFFVALGIYGYEFLVTKTIPLRNALGPFVIASTSIVWMLFFH